MIIAASQLKDLLGETVAEMPAELIQILPAIWGARGSVNPSALAIGLSAIVLILALNRIAVRLPGSIIAIAIGSAAVAFLALPVETLQSRFGSLPNGLPWISLPPISLERISQLLPSAFVIAFLAGVESLIVGAGCGSDDRRGASFQRRATCPGCRQHCFTSVRRAAGDRRDSKNCDQCSGRRTHSGCRYRPRHRDTARDGGGCAACGISRNARVGRTPDCHRVGDERAAQVARAPASAPRRQIPSVPDIRSHGLEQLDRGHRGRDRRWLWLCASSGERCRPPIGTPPER